MPDTKKSRRPADVEVSKILATLSELKPDARARVLQYVNERTSPLVGDGETT